MSRTAIVSALALALLASTISVVGGIAPAAATFEDPHGDHRDERIATLDPATVLAAIEAGQPFELPTLEGETTLAAGDRVQEKIPFTNVGLDGEPTTTVRPPNVWRVDAVDTQGHGVVLAFNHTLRAWIQNADGTTLIEPIEEGPGVPLPIADYVISRLPDPTGAQIPGSDDPGDETGVGILSHIQVYKDVYAYVDVEYRDQYGSCCWADQITYILALLNNYFDDVELAYRYDGGQVDTGFSSTDMDTAWNRLTGLSWNGADVRSHWSYKDFDGCEVGTAAFPGASFLIQHKTDACHLGLLPSTDAERAYLTAHELGKNNHAHPNYHWSDTTLTGHEHRSIMDDSLWGHYHECWSQTNMDRMSSYLGTSSVGTAC